MNVIIEGKEVIIEGSNWEYVKAWFKLYTYYPNRAQILEPDLFLKIKEISSKKINVPKTVLDIYELPHVFSDFLKYIKVEDEIIQVQELEMAIELTKKLFTHLDDVSELFNLILKGYTELPEFSELQVEFLKMLTITTDIEKVRPMLQKFLDKFKSMLADLTSQSLDIEFEKNSQYLNENNSDASKLYITELPEHPLITVELSRITKAVYHSGLLVRYRPKQIAVWLNQYCQVVKKKNGTVASIESIAKQISNVNSDEMRHYGRSGVQFEIDIIKQFPKIS